MQLVQLSDGSQAILSDDLKDLEELLLNKLGPDIAQLFHVFALRLQDAECELKDICDKCAGDLDVIIDTAEDLKVSLLGY